MLTLTRASGRRITLDPDDIERIDALPCTIVTLVDGTQYVVEEGLDEVIEQVAAVRAGVVSVATRRGPKDVPSIAPVLPIAGR